MPGTSTEPVVDKGIRQKSIHSMSHSIPFTHSLTAVPFVRGHRSVFPRTPRNTGVYTRHPTFGHSHEWRVDTASGLTLKKQNACLHAVRHVVGKKIACIHGLRSEGVNEMDHQQFWRTFWGHEIHVQVTRHTTQNTMNLMNAYLSLFSTDCLVSVESGVITTLSQCFGNAETAR